MALASLVYVAAGVVLIVGMIVVEHRETAGSHA
jgi:hypothetical protein